MQPNESKVFNMLKMYYPLALYYDGSRENMHIKIKAIKYVRDRLNLGLSEARDLVGSVIETYQRENTLRVTLFEIASKPILLSSPLLASLASSITNAEMGKIEEAHWEVLKGYLPSGRIDNTSTLKCVLLRIAELWIGPQTTVPNGSIRWTSPAMSNGNNPPGGIKKGYSNKKACRILLLEILKTLA